MDAIKFLKEKNRMTKKCSIDCSDCPLSSEKPNWFRVWRFAESVFRDCSFYCRKMVGGTSAGNKTDRVFETLPKCTNGG